LICAPRLISYWDWRPSSAIVAAFLGWSLARSGAYAGSLVTQHMWGGVFLAAVLLVVLDVARRFSGLRMNLTYAFGLAVMVGLVSWTGYRGGQLSQGENHLTEHMPAELRDWLGIAEEDKGPSAAGSTSFFVVRVEPVFAAHCTSCHGPSKRKSHLRLDTYEAVMRGGKGGPVIKAGNVRAASFSIVLRCRSATTNSCRRKASGRCRQTR